MDDRFQTVVAARFDQGVHVIRHHAPGKQRIPLSIKPKQGAFDQFRYFWKHEITRTVAVIKHGIGSLGTTILGQSLQLATKLCGKAIREAKDHVLD